MRLYVYIATNMGHWEGRNKEGRHYYSTAIGIHETTHILKLESHRPETRLKIFLK